MERFLNLHLIMEFLQDKNINKFSLKLAMMGKGIRSFYITYQNQI